MEIMLIMCPQNSFLHPQGTVYMGEKAETLKVRLIDYLSGFSGKRIFFRQKRAEADDFFVNDKTHSVVNTFDFHVLDDLKKYADIFYDITRYSGLYQSGLEIYLKKEQVQSVFVAGVETHTSVLFTVEELRNRGMNVTVLEPLTVSRDDYMHNAAVSLMTNVLGARLGS